MSDEQPYNIDIWSVYIMKIPKMFSLTKSDTSDKTKAGVSSGFASASSQASKAKTRPPSPLAMRNPIYLPVSKIDFIETLKARAEAKAKYFESKGNISAAVRERQNILRLKTELDHLNNSDLFSDAFSISTVNDILKDLHFDLNQDFTVTPTSGRAESETAYQSMTQDRSHTEVDEDEDADPFSDKNAIDNNGNG